METAKDQEREEVRTRLQNEMHDVRTTLTNEKEQVRDSLTAQIKEVRTRARYSGIERWKAAQQNKRIDFWLLKL